MRVGRRGLLFYGETPRAVFDADASGAAAKAQRDTLLFGAKNSEAKDDGRATARTFGGLTATPPEA